MHEGETCGQYKERIEEERRNDLTRQNEASEREVETISKPCPNCRAPLDKWTGCDHVTCKLMSFSVRYNTTNYLPRSNLPTRVLLAV